MSESNPPSPNPNSRPRRLGYFLFRMLPPLLLVTGVVGAMVMAKTAPRAEREEPPPMQSLVRVIEPEVKDQPVLVRAMGTVIPAREIQLRSQVGGKVIWIHPDFREGARFAQGDTLIKIDPADYTIARTRAEGQVARANYEYQIELGYQDVASREWELIREGRPATAREELLALRKPQLQNVTAGLASARAVLQQAELDLERTQLQTPFNALVRTRRVELGSVVSPQESVATLVGTDAYWVQVAIPVDRLNSLTSLLGQTGIEIPATVKLSGNHSPSWSGRVIGLLGDLEKNGRMARVLVSVSDPLGQHPTSPLLLGSFVFVDLEGTGLEQVAVLPRSALREGDNLWLAGPDNTLEIRPVEIPWRDLESVYVSEGLSPGDRVILTDLGIPVPGMPLIVQSSEDPDPAVEGHGS